MNNFRTSLLCATLALLSGFTASAAERPNLIFILADDMGYGDLGCYGAEKIKTPNIDRLAEEGILFTDGHSGASTCTPTRYGLLTGRHNWRTWLKYSALSTSAPLLIEEGRMTVASLLKSAGYATSIVGKWHLGYGREEGFEDNRGNTPPNYWETRDSGPNWNGELKPGPLEVGFDYAYVIPVANSFPPYVIVENHHVEGLRKDSPIGELESRNNGKMEGGEGARWKDEELVDKLTNKLVSQLEGFAKEKKPFFLYYAPHQPHHPWKPHSRFKGSSQAGKYGDVIVELDWSVGEVLKALDRLGLSQNTLVIFSSDNGSDGRDINGHRPNGPLRGGKGDLTEGGHRVPFLARWPGKIKPGTRSKETISQTDMLATFAALIGKELPPGAGPDSYNVLPALLGQKLPDPERPLVMSSGGTGALSIRAGKWKLLDGQGDCGYREFFSKRPHPAPKTNEPSGQLYNLEEDLGEKNNLYAQYPEIVQELKQTLEKIKADEDFNPTELDLTEEPGLAQEVEANRVVEVALESSRTYENPFMEIELDAVVTQPDGKELRVPMFWAGGRQWKLRYASPLTGVHTWRTACSDTANGKLHGVEGKITVLPNRGENKLYRHGPLRVSDNGRHFVHHDGTPFFWLADTWWKNLCKRMSWEGFQQLTADRKAKGFTAIQIVCGPYPDENMMESRWENEGGKPYEKRDFSVLNPAYFDYSDRRIAHLVDAGIVPVIVGGWGRPQHGGKSTLEQAGLDGFKRHWRHLVARYGAYPTVWVVGGEAKDAYGPWDELAKYVKAIDPFQRPLTYHAPGDPRQAIKDNAVFDFDMVAIGHDGFKTARETLTLMKSCLSKKPSRPVLCGEACYEGHMQTNFQDVQRHQFWSFMLSGAAGHTYGAAGVWHASVEDDPGITPVYDLTTWKEGMKYPGATQIGLGKKLLEQYPWSRFETHPEWVEEGCFAAGIPGEVRVIYAPRRKIYDWRGPFVKNLEPNVEWRVYYFDPASGRKIDQGTIKPGANGANETAKPVEFQKPLPSPQDWVLVFERVKR